MPGTIKKIRRCFVFKILAVLFLISGAAMGNTLMIGDSIFALTEKVPDNLRRAGLKFDFRAVSMAKIEDIAQQYRNYRDEIGVPEMVIMNGGGNNILTNREVLKHCLANDEVCVNYLREVNQVGQELWLEMQSDGVERVIYLGIHYLLSLHKLNPIIDIGMDEVAQMCAISPFRCDFVDVRPQFKNRTDLYLLDGVHVNDLGSQIISNSILDVI
jgi:hypothetical protein